MALACEKVVRILDGAAAQGDRRARPAGEYRRMSSALPSPSLSPLSRLRCSRFTPAAATGAVAAGARSGRSRRSRAAPAGWCATRSRTGSAERRAPASRSTGSRSSSTTTSTGFGIRATTIGPRAAHPARALPLVDAATGASCSTPPPARTPASTSSRPNMRPSPPSRPRSSGCRSSVADQIVTRIALYASRGGAPP